MGVVDLSTIGERIKEIRNDFSLKQTEFGKKIMVTHAHISHLEKGSVYPSDMLIKLIAIEFGVNEDWLRNGTGQKYTHIGKALDNMKSFPHTQAGNCPDTHTPNDSKLASYYREIVAALRPGGASEGHIPFMRYPEVIRMLNYLQFSYLSAEELRDERQREKEKLKLELKFQMAFTDFEEVIDELYNMHGSGADTPAGDNMASKYTANHNKHANIRETPEVYGSDSYVNIPTLGKVAAGIPISAVEDNSDLIPVPGSMHVDFALIVKGDSMEPDFPDNSIVFVKKQETLENGEIGIIMIENEMTCKKFYKLDDHIELRSINKSYAPIIVENKDIRILGKVVRNN